MNPVGRVARFGFIVSEVELRRLLLTKATDRHAR